MSESGESEDVERMSRESPPPQDDKTTVRSQPTFRSEKPAKKSKMAKVKELWGKTGLDVPTLLVMAKGALPPTIAIAIYQSTAVAETYTTLGYLVAIVSILGFAIMPRAKFVQTMTLNIIATLLATAINLLMMYSVVKARQHTEVASSSSSVGSPSPGASTSTYNSSASAVAAVWLFFQVYIVNTLRAKYQPTLQFPCIIYTIFVVVASIYGPQFATMTAAIAFAKRLLEAFLTGFAISSAVSLFILPSTSRKVVLRSMTAYTKSLQGTLKAHADYFESLEIKDMFYRVGTGISGDKERQPEAAKVKASVAGLLAMQGRVHGDLPFAKKEIAWGYLGPDDLQEISRLLRLVMLPLGGLSSVVDIFERLSELNSWNEPAANDEEEEEREDDRKRIVEDWNDIMQTVHEPFQSVIQAMEDGLQHVMLRLKLEKPPKKSKNAPAEEDIEAKGDRVEPGDDQFAEYLERKTERFYEGKELALEEWCKRKGVEVPKDYFKHPDTCEIGDSRQLEGTGFYRRTQRSLYALLYMEYLLYSTSRAVLDFVRFADEKAKSGKMDKKRIILPGWKRMRKWIRTMFQEDDTNHNAENLGDVDSSNQTLYMGEAYKKKRDPEHLPPETVMQKIGEYVRSIPRFLRSRESAFGFRVACGAMSIGIVNFLADTELFFVQQRLLWAMIMVAISMSPTAGQSVFSFILRVIGTVIAMVVSFLVYYIPDEHVAGVIVFFWFFAACGFYIVIKQPRFVIVGMISVVTLSMIIGYELEVRKIGQQTAASNGQPYYPIYLLAPYRLACVAGGLAVAFIWTIFPFPISEHSEMRNKLGAALYLLANYYSIVHETFRSRIRGDEGDMSLKTSPGRRLQKVRLAVYSKQLLILTNLQQISNFQKWEVPIGGRFPREKYTKILTCTDNIVRYMSLAAYASQTFSNPKDESQTVWSNDFRKLISSVNLTTHEITTLLALISASVTNGSPLPPYLKAPRPYELSRRLESLDKDILSLRHVAEPGYAAFAVIQIATRCIVKDLEKLLVEVKDLVGELDFSFHIVSVNSSRSSRVEMDPLSRRTTATQQSKQD